MVLILSEEEDVSTDYAVEWFRYYNIPFIRLNDRTSFNALRSIEFNGPEQEIVFEIDGKQMDLDDITGVWFRRGFIQFASGFFNVSEQGSAITEQIARLLQQENQTLVEYLVHRLLEKKSLNSQFYYNSNKLITLMYAARVGLKIPPGIVTNSLQPVEVSLGNDVREIIAKPVQDIFALKIGASMQSQYTEVLANYSVIPDRFYYTMFQQRIKKKYELRVFFIKNEFYACAIFTDAVDGRDLNAGQEQARIVPFKLPDEQIEKLIRLNGFLGLDSGSIDILVDQQQQYYFLEVNPVGQYDYVSKAGNYCLDEKIAQYFSP